VEPRVPDTPPEERRPVTLPRLVEMKQLGQPIVMVTAYDYPSAQVAEEAGVDVVLVGDTAAMTVLGYDSTTPVTMDEMVMLAKAVRRGLRTPLMICDLPFGSYQASDEQAVDSAARFVKETGCDAVKVEVVRDQGGTVIELHVAEDDMGKVIGRNGSVAKALRTLLKVTAAREGEPISLEIL